jgi:transcriptional regulator with XRE-family HTH domain
MAESDWVEVLRGECLASSQARMAKRLGVSATMISQVLAGKYRGDLGNLRARVQGELMGSTLRCPVLGEISRRDCLDWQAQPFDISTAIHVQIYWACRKGCPHSKLPQE